MDFFQGSSPSNSISFGSDKQGFQFTECAQIPDSGFNTIPAPIMVRSPPPFPPIRSPSSTDSNVEVTAYAEERARIHEDAQKLTGQQKSGQLAEDYEEIEDEEEDEDGKNESDKLSFAHPRTEATSLRIPTKAPTPGTTETAVELNLTHLETGLRVATPSRTALLDLLPAVDPVNGTSPA